MLKHTGLHSRLFFATVFPFFYITVLTSDFFLNVVHAFYSTIFLCHFSSFKINSFKMATNRCHQPDSEQDMIFQIMQTCFHHMLIPGFVLY